MNIRTLTVALAGAALFGLTAALSVLRTPGSSGSTLRRLLLPLCPAAARWRRACPVTHWKDH